jgi:hypothetical protein
MLIPLIGANLAYKDANMEHLYMVISYNIFVYLLKPFFFKFVTKILDLLSGQVVTGIIY